MKKTLMSTLLLAGIVGGMATTAHAADTATADTQVTAEVVSGGLIVTNVNDLDYGQMQIGSEDKDLKSEMTVTNYTGGDYQVNVKIANAFENGFSIAIDGNALTTEDAPATAKSGEGVADVEYTATATAGTKKATIANTINWTYSPSI